MRSLPPIVSDLSSELLFEIKRILGEKLLGFYLFGSVSTGDFDPDLSDIDLLSVIKDKLCKTEFENLKKMHNYLADLHPEWKDRIEVVYVTMDGIQNFREKESEIAVISPGEPFHLKSAGNDWLINWFLVRTNGIAIYGPSASDVVPEISEEEYVKAVRDYGLSWKNGIKGYSENNSRGSVAFVIFTMCRILYVVKYGKRLSKLTAVQRFEKEYPQWKTLITKAVNWREVQWGDRQETIGSDLENVVEFVKFVVSKIES